MHNQSIAQKIVNKKLFERNIVKLAFGGTAGMGSYRAPAAQNTSSAPAPAAAPAAAAKPIAPVKPARPSGRSTGSRLPAYLRNTSPRSTPARPKKPAGIYTPQHPAVEIAGGFLSGMGQGIGNMAGAVKDFGVGVARGVTAPFAAEFGRDMIDAHGGDGDDYANDMYNVYENAWSDVANSFGRFVGVHDAWDPNTGQYRGAQPANSAGQQLDTDIEQKYFSNPADADLRTAFGVTRAIGEGAAAAVPLAAAAPAVGAQLMRIPGAAAAGNAVANSTNPIAQTARAVSNYGFGVPVGTPNNAALIASNMAQNITGASLDAAAANNAINAANELAQTEAVLSELEAAGQQNSPEFANLAAQVDRLRAASTNTESTLARFLPAYQLDNVTRDALGDWAPGVLDAVRMGSNAPIRALTGQYATAPAMARGIQTATDAAHSGLDQLDQYLNPDNPAQPPQQTPLQAAEGLLAQNQNIEQESFPWTDAVTYAHPEDRGMLYAQALGPRPEQPAGDTVPPPGSQPTAPAGASATPSPGVAAAVQSLPQDMPDEQRAMVEDVVSNVEKNISPEVKALLEKPGGIEEFNAQTAETAVDQIAQERIAQETGPENPRDWAAWTSDIATWAKQTWDSLGPMGQLAFGIGLPLGVIGLLGGGLGGVLTAVLGFGVAGLAAAGSGALGETAQGAVMDTAAAAVAGAQNAVSAVTDTAQPAQPATGLKPATEMLSQEQLQTLTPQQIAAIESARSDPAKFRESASKAFWDAKTGLPAGEFGEFLRLPPDVMNTLFQQLPPAEQQSLLRSLRMAGSMAGRNKEMGAAINNAVTNLTREKNSMFNSKSASHIVAQHIAIATMHKAARCWSGYEPVPGKKPYSNDSCRPIGGKKKKKKKAAK